tara:strand:+ start:67 stop:273 length:207 start_codon:yes stop_codon:yes gene_type:complete
MAKNVDKYRSEVLTSLKYIEEKINSVDDRLDTLNGRVRKNEISIGWIKGIGSAFMGIIATVLGIFLND